MAITAKKMLNVAEDLYQGAFKGVPKASTTVNRAIKKVPKSINNQASKDMVQRIGKKSGLENAAGFRVNPKNPKSSPFKNANVIHKSNANMAHKTGNFFGGGIRDTINATKKGESFGTAIKAAHSNGDSLSKAKIAGTAATVGVAGRIASGGGLYRDRYGNVNLPGVPFI